ncbi:MAG: PAS domain S-box protein [Desulfuromonadales bacterium]|nr:PAS domain S-box protein [Desulfuromonadales bacterium]
MPTKHTTKTELLAEIETLRLRLEEAEETLRAIGSGEVDAFVVTSAEGEQKVFTLKGAEQPYRILVESMNEGAATLSANGVITYCNKRLSAMLNIPQESLLGTKLGAYVAPKDSLNYAALLDNCARESLSEEIALTTLAGVSIPVLVSCRANNMVGIQGISVVVTDLTHQKRNEEFLASENFSTSIVEQANEALIVCDEKGKIIRASQSAHELCGTNPLLKPFHKVFRLRIMESGELFSLAHAMRDGSPKSIEVEFKRDEDRIYTLYLNATSLKDFQRQTIGSIVTLTDISERKLAEQALVQSELRLQAAYSHIQVVNKELQIANEELQYQNQELARLWEIAQRSDEALRKSEALYRGIGESIDYGVWVCAPDGRNTYASESFLKMVGITQEQCSNFGWGNVLHPDDAERTISAWKECVRTGGVWDIEHRFHSVDGQLRHVLARGVPVKNEQGDITCWAGINLDITRLKVVEEKLQKKEQMIQQALDVSRSFTFDWQPITDQVIRSASCGTVLNITGEEAVNDTGDHFFQRIHPHDRALFEQTLHNLTPASSSYLIEYRYLCKDGSEISLEETGQATFDSVGKMQRLFGVATDITARKKAEQQLKKVLSELEQRVQERTMELSASIDRLQSEIEERKKAEHSLQVESAERIRAVEALREKEKVLLHQSRLAAMGEMINNIAHQWRQPLNALAVLVQQMQLFFDMNMFSKEFLYESVDRSMGLINHMSRTIDDFRSFFKPDKEKVEFTIRDVVEKTLALVEDGFSNHRIGLDCRFNANPVLFGFPNEYSQALLNILMNARDALVEKRVKDAKIRVTIAREHDKAVLTIADNAGGIPHEILDRIFDPYFTTKGPDKGTGVGLFMSKTIIEKNMNGSLTARNTAEGAEFRIEI